MELQLNFYSKQALSLNPEFRLDKLYSNSLNVSMDEFSIQFSTAIKYQMALNMLCIDIFSEVEEYNLLVDTVARYVECSKTLVDCFYDFGQFTAKSDSATTKKPYSPYAKLLDSCNLSSTTQAITIKNYAPLEDEPSRKQYWVGSGNYDDSCYPGNILIGLIDYDHNIAMLQAQGPQVQATAGNWGKIIHETIKPIYQDTILNGIQALKDMVADYQPDHEDGTYTVVDHGVEDYMPLKK